MKTIITILFCLFVNMQTFSQPICSTEQFIKLDEHKKIIEDMIDSTEKRLNTVCIQYEKQYDKEHPHEPKSSAALKYLDGLTKNPEVVALQKADDSLRFELLHCLRHMLPNITTTAECFYIIEGANSLNSIASLHIVTAVKRNKLYVDAIEWAEQEMPCDTISLICIIQTKKPISEYSWDQVWSMLTYTHKFRDIQITTATSDAWYEKLKNTGNCPIRQNLFERYVRSFGIFNLAPLPGGW